MPSLHPRQGKSVRGLRVQDPTEPYQNTWCLTTVMKEVSVPLTSVKHDLQTTAVNAAHCVHNRMRVSVPLKTSTTQHNKEKVNPSASESRKHGVRLQVSVPLNSIKHDLADITYEVSVPLNTRSYPTRGDLQRSQARPRSELARARLATKRRIPQDGKSAEWRPEIPCRPIHKQAWGQQEV